MHTHVWTFVYGKHNFEVLECYCGKRITVYDE